MTDGYDLDKAQVISEIRTVIQEVRDLPTLPTIAVEIRRLVDDPKSNISDMVNVVDQDMALTSRILRIANSAYYGIPRKVDNLKMAMVILGIREVVNLVTSISILRMFKDSVGDDNFDLPEFWRHSAFCAELTVGLYKGLGIALPSSAYITGLLHDIGKLVLNQYFPDYQSSCIQYAQENNLRIVEAEVKLLGIDHGHIGSWLTKRWNIPEEIIGAIAQHHIRPPDSKRYGMASIVDWADRLYYIIDKNTIERASEILKTHSQWQTWLHKDTHSTNKILTVLYKRWERSLTLIELIK